MMSIGQDEQNRMLQELSALVLNLLRSPRKATQCSDHRSPAEYRPAAKITPAGFASLLLGISLTLMLCGSVTFVIGFILMPWVIGLVMVFYVVGIISSLSMLGRSIIGYATAAAPRPRPPPPPKGVPAWKLL